MVRRALLAGIVLLGCGKRTSHPTAPAPGADHRVLRGAVVVGLGARDVEIAGGRIVAVAAPGTLTGTVVPATGRWLAPGFIDSHVHLSYLRAGDELSRRGVALAVDLAAPEIGQPQPLRMLESGPMLTAPDGYPLSSWGQGGYGIPLRDAADGTAAVDRVARAGARVVKVPLGEPPVIDDATLAAIVRRAHEKQLPVAVHALDAASAARAAAAGADVLAHTPVEPLSDAVVRAWRERAVITTLAAFGGDAATVDNLRRLRAAGATVLYGTDLGNTRDAGISADEIALMIAAGMSPADILASGTSAPAKFWRQDDLGEIAPGKAAILMSLPRDPLADPSALAEAVTLR